MAGKLEGKLVIAGGSYWQDNEKHWSDRTDYFDPARNEWRRGAPMPDVLSDAACVTFKGSLYTFGGGQHGTIIRETWELSENRWRRLPHAKIPAPRLYAAAALVGSFIYVTGGLSKADDYRSATNTVWRWNPLSTAGWEEIAPMPGDPRVSHAVVGLGGKLYVFGGVTMEGATLRNLDDAYVYAPADRKWTTLPKLPMARRAFWATAVHGRILLFGGYTTDFSPDVFEFDPKTKSTVKIGTMPHPVADAKFILLDRHILTTGGEAANKVRGIWTLEGEVP